MTLASKQQTTDILPISYDDIMHAHDRIRGIAHHTPVMTSAIADQNTDAKLFFKCEHFQRVGAFKFRGAYNALAQFTDTQRQGGVLAYSSGNHAQAVALAARLTDMKAVILMPSNAPRVKVEATRNYGGEVVFYDRYTEDRETIGGRIAKERGLTIVSPYNHPAVMAGQGTAAKELFEDADTLDVVLAPVGGGGLLSGCAVAAKALNPDCIVIGVEPQAGNDAQQSFRSGKLIRISTPDTIADGAQTQCIGDMPFSIIQKLVSDIVTVSDAELIDAMTFFASRMKMIVEPTGCLAAAAVLSGKVDVRGKRIGIILSGGNIDLQRFAYFVQKHIKY